MMRETQFPADAHDRLIAWYERFRRDLPWRSTRDPYRILVSEIMLQQTQAERVIPKYHEFLARFPTIDALADAPTSEVIRKWSGLGYNRRALNLQRAARAVVDEYGGVMPSSPLELARLPGIGPYTAGAIACFAYEQDVGFVDTNIRRVLHRVLLGPELPTPQLTPRQIEALAHDVVPPGRGYTWNQALMELGATICRARTAECERCPLQDICAARPTIQHILATAPRSGKKPEPRFETTSRYFRGRIVDALRDASLDGLTLDELGSFVKSDFGPSDVNWIAGHVAGLVRDGLVVPAVQGLSEEVVEYEGLAGDGDVRYRLPE
jgi:A/G-specific adenine glycosylase